MAHLFHPQNPPTSALVVVSSKWVVVMVSRQAVDVEISDRRYEPYLRLQVPGCGDALNDFGRHYEHVD